MTWRGSLIAALLATLAHPRWWAIALAGFLVRGGVALILLPIVVPPTVAGLMSSLAPSIIGSVIIGGSGAPIALLTLLIAGTLLAWLAVAATFGTWFDTALVREALDGDDGETDAFGQGATAVPIPRGLASARLAPHLLTALVFAYAATRVIAVAYVEATSPGAPTTPFVVRVIGQTPVEVGVLVAAWLIAEAVGGLALRLLLLSRPPVSHGVVATVVRAAWLTVHPRALLTLAGTLLATVVIAAPGWLASARAWSQLRLLLTAGADVGGLTIGLLIFVAVVLGWLTLLGVALAWRSAVWTSLAVAAA